MVLTDVCCSFT